MRKLLTMGLAALLALGLMAGALAEEPAAAAEEPVVQEEAAQPTGLEQALALKLESGLTYEELLVALDGLDAFKAATLGQQLRIIRAQLTLGKLTVADAKALFTALASDSAMAQRMAREDNAQGGMIRRGMQRMPKQGKGRQGNWGVTNKGWFAQPGRGMRLQDCPCLNNPEATAAPTEETAPAN